MPYFGAVSSSACIIRFACGMRMPPFMPVYKSVSPSPTQSRFSKKRRAACGCAFMNACEPKRPFSSLSNRTYAISGLSFMHRIASSTSSTPEVLSFAVWALAGPASIRNSASAAPAKPAAHASRPAASGCSHGAISACAPLPASIPHSTIASVRIVCSRINSGRQPGVEKFGSSIAAQVS